MLMFKTLDIRGLPFAFAFERTQKEFRNLGKNGVLEIILDQKRNFTEAFENWAKSKGCPVSDLDVDNRFVRIFIQKNRIN
jgi:TusA-related sulfurtransferase